MHPRIPICASKLSIRSSALLARSDHLLSPPGHRQIKFIQNEHIARSYVLSETFSGQMASSLYATNSSLTFARPARVRGNFCAWAHLWVECYLKRNSIYTRPHKGRGLTGNFIWIVNEPLLMRAIILFLFIRPCGCEILIGGAP